MMTPRGKREEDHSVFARFALHRQKFGPLYTLGVAIVLAAGFGFKTPAQTFNAINEKIDTNRVSSKAQLDSIGRRTAALEMVQRGQDENIRILIRALCVNAMLSPRDRALINLTPERCNQ